MWIAFPWNVVEPLLRLDELDEELATVGVGMGLVEGESFQGLYLLLFPAVPVEVGTDAYALMCVVVVPHRQTQFLPP